MKTNNELKELLSTLTLSEKIGQMSQVFGDMLNEDDPNLSEHQKENGFGDGKIYEIGSVSGVSGAENVRKIQANYLEHSRHKIPLLFMVDVIHGYRLNYQIAAGLGCAFDDKLVYDLSKMQANEAVAAGVSVSYTPMADLTNDPRWGRMMEIPSEDVHLNENYISTIVKAMQGDQKLQNGNMATCVKHIAGYGLAEGGRDYGDANASAYSLENMYFPLYKSGLKAGSLMAMTAFNSLNGIPSTGNKHLLRNKLRRDWNFNGVLISDHSSINELIVHGYAKDEKDAAKKAVEAGVDIELGTYLYRNNLEQLVTENAVSEQLIDEAVYRILELKNKLGLFDDPYAGISLEKESDLQNLASSFELCKKSAVKSMVLLKNDQGILPLNNDDKFDLCGPLADSKELIGFNACSANLDDVITIKEGLKNYNCDFYSGIDYESYEQIEIDKIKASNNETVVMAIGEYTRYSGEGISRSNISVPKAQIEAMKQISAESKKIIAVVFAGRALNLTEVNKYADAILYAWYPGIETGNAVAEILFGKENPSAKLSFSLVKDIGQIPLKYNHLNTGRPKVHPNQEYVNGYRDIDNDPLYAFGFGMSYSTFEYGELKLSQTTINQNEKINVEIDVTNTSSVNGEEIVQLYIRDLVSDYVRPVKELKGYQKKAIPAKETEKFEFEISINDLKYYNELGKEIFEPGEFEVFVGPSSNETQSKIITLK